MIWELLAKIDQKGIVLEDIQASKLKIDRALLQVNEEALRLASNLFAGIRNNERVAINDLAEIFLARDYRPLISQKYPLLSTSELQHYRKESVNYPAYFYRNLILFSHHLQADLYLLSFSTKIQGLTEQILDYTQENYLSKIHQNMSDLKEQLSTFSKKLKNSE